MATSLFSEVRSRQLSAQLGGVLDNNYTARPIVRTGIVLSSNQVQVANQRYALSGGSSDLVIGSRLAVQNVGRAAAAIYTPSMSSGAPLMGSAGVAFSGASKGGGDLPPPGWIPPDNQINNITFNNSQFSSLHGVIGDLNGNYGYTSETYGTAFGDFATVNITTDPTNGFRIRNYETAVFQADTSGVVWALSTFRAGTGDNSISITATDADYRLFAGSETSSDAPLRITNTGRIGFFADGAYATQGSVFWSNTSTGAEGEILLTDAGGTIADPASALILQAKGVLTNTRFWMVADGPNHDYYAFISALGPDSADFKGLRVGGGGIPSATIEVVGNVYASAGYLTKDVVPADFTVPADYTMIYPNMSVPGGITVTVAGTLIDFVLP